jgi:LEA14-like dessication related protein
MIVLLGCAGLGKTLETPRISLANIQPLQAKGFEAVFQIELRVFNTNDVAISIKGVDCELELNGRKVASGISKVEKTIPSYGTDTVPITVYSSMLDMVRGMFNLREQEKIRYKIKGRLRLGETGFFVPSTIPFSSEGIVPDDTRMKPQVKASDAPLCFSRHFLWIERHRNEGQAQRFSCAYSSTEDRILTRSREDLIGGGRPTAMI